MNYMALKKNLDVTIHEAFLEEILRGNWLPGQALNLDELAERYGVSRTPVQQALKRMHTQGMVVFPARDISPCRPSARRKCATSLRFAFCWSIRL